MNNVLEAARRIAALGVGLNLLQREEAAQIAYEEGWVDGGGWMDPSPEEQQLHDDVVTVQKHLWALVKGAWSGFKGCETDLGEAGMVETAPCDEYIDGYSAVASDIPGLLDILVE